MPPKKIQRVFVLAALWSAMGRPLEAQTVENFYAGKTIKVIVGTAPGGGYDLYGRFLARHIGRHIPGRPSVVTINMPGAASIAAANYLANIGPRDGTEMLTVVQTLPMVQALGGDKIHFDLAAFNWLGNMVTTPNVFVSWRGAPVRTLDDALSNELIVGATTPTAIAYIYPAILNKVLGARFKIVTGYANGEAVDVAMERGEVGGRAGTSWAMLKATRAAHIRNNDVNVFLQVGLKKEPELPGVPLLTDLARNENQRRIFEFYSGLTAVAHAFATGPGVPPDRVEALRRAFDDTTRDPVFIREAATMNLEIDPLSGVDVQKAVSAMARTDPALLMLDEASLIADEPSPGKRKP